MRALAVFLFVAACNVGIRSTDPVTSGAANHELATGSDTPSSTSSDSTTRVTSQVERTGNRTVTGDVAIEWRVARGTDKRVEVTIVVAGIPTTLGSLHAGAESGPSGPKTCHIITGTESESRFSCGNTSAFNGFDATLVDSELVIELETFTETGKLSTDRKLVEVKRLPVAGDQLVVAPFVAK